MRAIILAAGMGTRLRPLTLTTPKALTIVNGKPLLERQIEFLKEKDINEIVVVTGYLNEEFEYLKEKYEIKIVFNDKYDKYNNIYTMNLVKDYLGDSYVIDADIYLWRNFFENDIEKSTYFSPLKKSFENEWKIVHDENLDVKRIDIIENGSGYILSGVSYWNKKDAEIIVSELNKIIEKSNFDDYYWDDIVRINIGKLDVKLRKLDENDIYEIDSIDELNELNYIINKL
ncbi:sugar phosphate nucleotidyltransferase [Clostridium sardiniense]